MSPDDFQLQLDKRQTDKETQAAAEAQTAEIKQSVEQSGNIIAKAVKGTTDGLKNVDGKIEVKNFPTIAAPKDITQLSDKIDNFTLTTFVTQNGMLTEILDSIKKLSIMLESITKEQATTAKSLSDSLVAGLPTFPEPLKEVGVNNLSDLQAYFTKLSTEIKTAIKALKLDPQITVKAPEVKQQIVDLQPVVNSLDKLQAKLSIPIPEAPKIDFSSLVKATVSVKKSVEALRFPVSNYVLPFSTQTGKATQLKLNDDGSLPSTVSGGKLVTDKFDYISRTLTNSTTETYVYKTGGSGGVTVATVVVVYTDSTLANISTVTRT